MVGCPIVRILRLLEHNFYVLILRKKTQRGQNVPKLKEETVQSQTKILFYRKCLFKGG